jgi:hypothetical protein
MDKLKRSCYSCKTSGLVVKISETLGALALFILAFSLVGLSGLSPAHAEQFTPPSGTTALTQWWPSGPSADAIRFQYYTGTTGDVNEYNAMCFNQPSTCTPQIDLTDVQIPSSYSPVSYPPNSWVTPITPGWDMEAVSFNLANSFFGIEFCNGADGVTNSSTCPDGPGATAIPATCPGTIYKTSTGLLDCTLAGIAIRQGIAHLIDKQGYVSNVLQGNGYATDNPISGSQSLPHSGLPDPCAGLPPAACTPDVISNAQGTGPYAFDPTLPVGSQRVPIGSEPACITAAQQQGNGGPCELTAAGACSWDLLGQCGTSAFHLGVDGAATANGMVNPGSPDFCAAAQLWVNAGLGTGVSSPSTGCQIQNFCINHGGGTGCFTTGIAGTPGGRILLWRRTSLDRGPLFTGLGAAICQLINGPSATTCPQVEVFTPQLPGGPYTPTPGCLSASEPGTNCSTQGPNRDWSMFVDGHTLGPNPDQVWNLYNSQFASDLCGGVPNETGLNYAYVCNSTFDYWSGNSEFAASPGAAIADLQIAMDIFGNHTFAIPVFGHSSSQAYLMGWTGVSNSPTSGSSDVGNYWSLLNMWNPSPTLPGPTIRWGQDNSPDTLNPFLANYTVAWNVLNEIYDPLLQVNPYNPDQLFGWMVNSYSIVTNGQDSNCPVTVTRGAASFSVAGCVKLNLPGDISWHDIMSCRNTDAICLEAHSVTASDIKFSVAAFNATSGIVAPSTSNILDVVYSPSVLPSAAFGTYGGTESAGQPEVVYVALKSLSAWAVFDLTSIPIVPQHVWATAGSTGPCQTLGTPQCSIDPNYITGAGSDPVANNRLIGSGPYVCASGVLGAPGTVVGGGCGPCTTCGSPDMIMLTRFGSGLNLNYAFFRSNGKFKNFSWADYLALGSGPSNGFGAHGVVTINDIQSVASCLGKSAPSGACTPAAFAHWSNPAASVSFVSTAGPNIGAVGGGASPVSIGTVAQVARWYNTQWLDSLTGLGPVPLLYGANGNQLPGAQPAPGTGNQVMYEDGTNETS